MRRPCMTDLNGVVERSLRRLRLWLAGLLCPKGWSLITDNEYTRAGNALWGEAVRNPTSLTSIKTEGGYGYMFTGGVADPDVNIPGSNMPHNEGGRDAE